MNPLELIRGLFVVALIAGCGWGWMLWAEARDRREWAENTLRGEIHRALNARSLDELKREVRERWPHIATRGRL